VLIYYGNARYSVENLIIGIFFIYIAFVQLLEWFIWFDIDGKKGLNKIATQILPIYIYIQPLVLYTLEVVIYGISISTKMLAIGILYLSYILIYYLNYINIFENKIITSKNNTLDWRWFTNNSFNSILYFTFFIYAIFTFMPLEIALFGFIIMICFGSLSVAYYKYRYGNFSSGFFSGCFFCFISAFSPILLLLFETVVSKMPTKLI